VVGVGVDVDVDADVDTSAISSLAMSMSVEMGMMGSEARATTAAASEVVACIITDAPRGAVSAAEIDFDGVGGGGFEDVFLAERLVDAGLRGQPRESCPTALQRGQALSDPGHEAKTLKPSMSKKGVAVRVLPTAGSLRTMSQRLVERGRPLTV
jgi:hypothetical protein